MVWTLYLVLAKGLFRCWRVKSCLTLYASSSANLQRGKRKKICLMQTPPLFLLTPRIEVNVLIIPDNSLQLESNVLFPVDIYSFLDNVDEEETIRNYSAWNDHSGNLRGPYQDHTIRCFAYVAKEGFCLRANTLSTYCEINRQVGLIS